VAVWFTRGQVFVLNMPDKTPVVWLSSEEGLWPLNIPGYRQA